MIAIVRPDLTYKITGIPDQYLRDMLGRVIVLEENDRSCSNLFFSDDWTWRREWLLNIREEGE